MKIISLKKEFECDHSSTKTKYIMGFAVTCDYDWWTCEFKIPFNKKLYDEIKKYKANKDYELWIEKKGKSILISIHVSLDYEAVGDNDPFVEFANICAEIKENILKGDFSDLKLLQAFVLGKDEFSEMESSSGIENIIENVC